MTHEQKLHTARQEDFREYRYGDEDHRRRAEERARYQARHACRATKMVILMYGEKR